VLLRFASLADVPGLRHALTTRRAPALADGGVADALGFERVVTLRQVHGARVVDLDTVPADPPAADAVVLRRSGLLAAVVGADCPLLLLVAPRPRVLALVHSGWRGTAAGVVGEAVRHLERVHGALPDEIRVAIGPSMCGAHYEVGEEVIEAVAAAVPECDGLFRATRPGHALLDLGLALERQLHAVGVSEPAIERCRACTWEAVDTFHSHRRDGASAGRHALVAGWAGRDPLPPC
jgi:YfiH family protein